MLRLKNMQNSNENEILLISSCRKIHHVIINDYKTIDDKYLNINDQSFV